MWRKNRNVKITYTRIPNTSPAQIDDVVTYQPLNSDSIKTVHGVDRPFEVPDLKVNDAEGQDRKDRASLGYHWRGKGWLMIASSKWEILGYGEEEGGANHWVVTYFAKTLFTPEGLDIYSRTGPLKDSTIGEIKSALKGLGGQVARLAEMLFVVAVDEAKDSIELDTKAGEEDA